MTQIDTNAPQSAAYYDNDDTAAFYQLCWGGSDIHIGRYDTGAETVAEASAAMTRYLLSLTNLNRGDRVLDIACGYGGTLRELARIGCHPKGMDISRLCVEEARRANKEAGLGDTVPVEVGDFHDIPGPDAHWDACVCQESIIHSTKRPRVFAEVYRVLRPGGVFAFSDILSAEKADLALVDAAFVRLGVRGGATPADYRDMAQEAGFEIEHIEERPADIKRHYDKLALELASPPASLSDSAVARLSASIQSWQKALAAGHITWACFVARKPDPAK
ncbi:MAG: methyltransferase domain-containing protein [Sulfitobacter sp.]|nr:methyltransferase domain-containing protein [Sulfitobacter sp.]